MPEILEDKAFCRRLRHCFLVRHPMLSILSYYRLDPNVSLEEIGFESQWRQLQGLRSLGITDAIVLEAEAVQSDTANQLREFFRQLGLEHRPEALAWQQDSTPQDWQYVKGWHEQVSHSKGIEAMDSSQLAAKQAEFDRLCQSNPVLGEYLEHHMPYYRDLLQFRFDTTANVD